MGGVYLSVYLSVCRVPLPNSRIKRHIGSQKLAGWKPIHGKTVNLFRGEKVKGQGHQGSRPINAVIDNALANTSREAKPSVTAAPMTIWRSCCNEQVGALEFS